MSVLEFSVHVSCESHRHSVPSMSLLAWHDFFSLMFVHPMPVHSPLALHSGAVSLDESEHSPVTYGRPSTNRIRPSGKSGSSAHNMMPS